MKKKIVTMLAATMATMATWAQNPFLPLWEYIPDGEPYVFDDPDVPGKKRLYVYGSHDSLVKEYCGREQVVWSAPVEDLTAWRYDGVIMRSVCDAEGKLLNKDGKGDVLYAPDVAVRTEEDGSKTYFLFPNNQAWGRNSMVAKAKRPDGPFTVCNWNTEKPRETVGVMRFDPAVFIDDDGRVYGYWGFEQSWAAELDPATMATVKPGTEVVRDLIPNYKQDKVYRFFEASSMRKIEDKYVFIYSRWTNDGEFGLPQTNYTLAYAYGDNPLGPFTYGGTIIDGRGRDTDVVTGKPVSTATSGGNTHGSIVKVNGQWFVVYHRQTGLDEFSRQAMAAPISVSVEKGKGGKVVISEAEYTSEGFCTEGLNPLQRIAAGTACYYTGPKASGNKYPAFIHAGSYVSPSRVASAKEQASRYLTPVVNNVAGSVVGYKYLNLSGIPEKAALVLCIKPHGTRGTVRLMLDSPYKERGGTVVGTYEIRESLEEIPQEVVIALRGLKKGKHALFFLFDSAVADKSLCDMYDFRIITNGKWRMESGE